MKHVSRPLKFIFLMVTMIFFVACINRNDKQESGAEKHVYRSQQLSQEDSVLILKTQIYENIKSPNLYECSGKRKGDWTILFDNNWKKTNDLKEFTYYRKLTYKNGLPIGTVTDHFLYGNKQWEGSITSDTIKDIINGNSIWYYSDGKVKQRNFYNNGIKAGIEIDYNSNGNIVAKRHYSKGVLHGQLTNLYDNGKIKSLYNYNYGNLNGPQVEYSAEKKILSKENYSNGTLSGFYAKYFDNGKPEQLGNFYEGNKTGTWYYYDYDGDYKQTQFIQVRVGAICNDGWESSATGRGACSHHGGVNYWLVDTKEIVIDGIGKYKLNNNYEN